MRKPDELTQTQSNTPEQAKQAETKPAEPLSIDQLNETELKALAFDLQAAMAVTQQRLNAVFNELNKRYG